MIGHGTKGWQATEKINNSEDSSAASDLFSFGIVIFYSITGGFHPYSDNPDIEDNIKMGNKQNLMLLDHMPVARDLVSQLLEDDPKRLHFLKDASDLMASEGNNNPTLRQALLQVDTGSSGKGPLQWDKRIDVEVLEEAKKHVNYDYKYDSTLHLLRFMRNQNNHYRDLPKTSMEENPYPEGLDKYFDKQLPSFFIGVYKVMYENCKQDKHLSTYFESES
ncbi:Protein kinase domain [Macleaya cordata]|uniref:Protein kinase domain n=1 Tax=Macleaya cordata TaxID=56857 RepID=A0A200QLP7_MACCD|nr:Protein kinase domain [Macleaya cordata]